MAAASMPTLATKIQDWSPAQPCEASHHHALLHKFFLDLSRRGIHFSQVWRKYLNAATEEGGYITTARLHEIRTEVADVYANNKEYDLMEQRSLHYWTDPTTRSAVSFLLLAYVYSFFISRTC